MAACETLVANDIPSPPWLINLESRLKSIKQSHQLGHEVGAGSACLKCEICPGLDLHYWRKKCISCKCRKEDHDVPPDDSVIRLEILLTNPESKRFKSFHGELEIKMSKGQPTKGTDKHFDSLDNTVPAGKVVFDWLPAETPSELTAAYMKELPLKKLPISGSEGARYRQLQLNKQIPLYDISPEIRHKLSATGQQEFQAYLEDVRSNVGIGKIQKICQKSFLEESCAQPIMQKPEISTTMKQTNNMKEQPLTISNKYCPNVLEKFNNNNLNVNPKPFKPFQQPINKINERNSNSDNSEMSLNTNPFKLKPPSSFNSRPKSPRVDEYPCAKISSDNLSSFPSEYSQKTDSVNSNSTNFPPTSHIDLHRQNKSIPKLSSQIENITINDNTDPLNNAGFPISEDSSAGRKTYSGYTKSIQMGFDSHPEGYTAVPPPTDISQQPTNRLSNRGQNQFLDSETSLELNNRKDLLAVEKALDCWQCKEVLQFGSVAVVTDRAGLDKAWHPQCFVCCICKELLVDLVYFYHLEQVYCGRHYAEIKNIKRCCACDELIFVNEFTLAECNAYHVNHFCCASCDLQLGGNKYIMYDNQPNCLNCYDQLYSDRCQSCQLPICAEQQGVKLKHLTWHASVECFKCAGCQNSLLNSKFVVVDNKPFCSKKCVQSF